MKQAFSLRRDAPTRTSGALYHSLSVAHCVQIVKSFQTICGCRQEVLDSKTENECHRASWGTGISDT